MRGGFLAALALALLASSFRGEDGAEGGPDDAAKLRGEIAERIAQGSDGLAGALASLGGAAIRPLLDVLAGGQVVVADGPPAALDDGARTAVREALAAMPLPDLRAGLAALAADPACDDARAVAALDVLGRVGGASDVSLCVRLAQSIAPDAVLTRARRVAFEQAVASIAARDDDTAWAVHGVFRELAPPLLAPAVRCIAAGEPAGALSILASLLDTASGIDGFLLAEIARVGADAPRPVDGEVCKSVRRRLGSRDVNETILAARALGVLDDFDAFPRLIELVDADDERLSEAADEALEAMSGRVFRGNARAWDGWYAEESAWWRRAQASLSKVDAPSATVALAALHDISGHRLNRHQIAEAVVVAVRRREREIVLVACSILRSLDSSAAVPALIDALERPEPELSGAIHAALRSITGRDLPADDALWQAIARREMSSTGR